MNNTYEFNPDASYSWSPDNEVIHREFAHPRSDCTRLGCTPESFEIRTAQPRIEYTWSYVVLIVVVVLSGLNIFCLIIFYTDRCT